MKGLGVPFVDKEDDSSTKHVPVKDLRTEAGAEDLLDSAAMEPYVNLAVAIVKGENVDSALKELAALPLEKRYVWRIASALKGAFADFDSVNVEADRQTLSRKDRLRLLDLLQHRPVQFCMFLSALLGQKQMEALMISALKNARVVAEHSDR
jgi:hypothetical protein